MEDFYWVDALTLNEKIADIEHESDVYTWETCDPTSESMWLKQVRTTLMGNNFRLWNLCLIGHFTDKKSFIDSLE